MSMPHLEVTAQERAMKAQELYCWECFGCISVSIQILTGRSPWHPSPTPGKRRTFNIPVAETFNVIAGTRWNLHQRPRSCPIDASKERIISVILLVYRDALRSTQVNNINAVPFRAA
jgi:hypothetical protein